jgi:hypothetical protein
MTNRSILLVLFLLPLAAGRGLRAQSVGGIGDLTPGMHVRVDAPGVVAPRFVGTVLLPPADSLLLASPDGPPVVLRPSQITSLEVSRGRDRRKGALRGLLVGAPVGLAIGTTLPGNEAGPPECRCVVRERRLSYAVAGALVGAATGALIGSLVGPERWVRLPLPGRSP